MTFDSENPTQSHRNQFTRNKHVILFSFILIDLFSALCSHSLSLNHTHTPVSPAPPQGAFNLAVAVVASSHLLLPVRVSFLFALRPSSPLPLRSRCLVGKLKARKLCKMNT